MRATSPSRLALGAVLLAISIAVSACAFPGSKPCRTEPRRRSHEPLQPSGSSPSGRVLSLLMTFSATCGRAQKSSDGHNRPAASTTSGSGQRIAGPHPASIHRRDWYRRACACPGHRSGTGNRCPWRRRSATCARPPGGSGLHGGGAWFQPDKEIAWNDFIVVGPDADPAHVADQTDVAAAHSRRSPPPPLHSFRVVTRADTRRRRKATMGGRRGHPVW